MDKPTPFLGRDALAKQQAAGVRKRLVLFTFDDPAAFPWGGEPILMDGSNVGELTSAGYSRKLGRAVAMGYARADDTAHRRRRARREVPGRHRRRAVRGDAAPQARVARGDRARGLARSRPKFGLRLCPGQPPSAPICVSVPAFPPRSRGPPDAASFHHAAPPRAHAIEARRRDRAGPEPDARPQHSRGARQGRGRHLADGGRAARRPAGVDDAPAALDARAAGLRPPRRRPRPLVRRPAGVHRRRRISRQSRFRRAKATSTCGG